MEIQSKNGMEWHQINENQNVQAKQKEIKS